MNVDATGEAEAPARPGVLRAARLPRPDAGPEGLSINAIARELGVSGPALYRLFASRDALRTELIVDAYDDLADALFEAELA